MIDKYRMRAKIARINNNISIFFRKTRYLLTNTALAEWKFFNRVGGYLSAISATAVTSASTTGVVAGAVGAVIILMCVFVWAVGMSLNFNSDWVMNLVIGGSLVVNVVLIFWMFFKREYRYYWLMVTKLYRYTMQAKPYVKVIFIYRNKGIEEFIMPVENEEIDFKRNGKHYTYHITTDALYHDLRGNWTSVVIEEDNAKAKVFHTNEDYISADALARIILKTKDWAEIKAARKNKMILYLLIGCLIASVATCGYLYYVNDGLQNMISTACNSALEKMILQFQQAGFINPVSVGTR